MHFYRTTSLMASLLLSSPFSNAQFVIDNLSFGLMQNISPNGRDIPSWHIAGEGHEPQLLSDRVVLTPPAPGNRRGAVWAEHSLDHAEWKAELDFRATGPERGSGNLQIWLTKDVQAAQGLSSLYTVDQFDGLVLVLDQYGGSGGALRGFLSDGTASYRNHHNVDSLAFGHCPFAYRNRGAMSKLTLAQKPDGFEVLLDEKMCFRSDQVRPLLVCARQSCLSVLLTVRANRSTSRSATTSAFRRRRQRRRTRLRLPGS